MIQVDLEIFLMFLHAWIKFCSLVLFFDRLPVSLQVPGARCHVRENSTSKLGKTNLCVGKSIKMEHLLYEHLYLKMDILPSRKDFRIDDVTNLDLENRNKRNNSFKNNARKTKIHTLKLFVVLNPKIEFMFNKNHYFPVNQPFCDFQKIIFGAKKFFRNSFEKIL